MGTIIHYFSGTGNSLFIANKLQETLPHSKAIPILQALKDSARKVAAEKVVVVFPVYAIPMPSMVISKIKKGKGLMLLNYKNANGGLTIHG